MRLLPKQAGAITKIVAHEKTRYALNAVRYEELPDNKARLEATDGRRLLRVDYACQPEADYPAIPALQAAANTGTSALIPPAALEAAAKAVKKSRRPIIETFAVKPDDKGNVTLASTDLETESVQAVRGVEGTWPPTDDVIPQGEPIAKVRLGGALLVSLLDAIGKMLPDGLAGVDVSFYGADRPVKLVRRTPGGEAVAVLMPINPY